MSRPEERQGYIGDITTKSLAELKELLDRKEKFLANRSLLEKLPDKGKKAHEYVYKLKELIKEKAKKNDTRMEVCGYVAAITSQSVKENVTGVNAMASKEGSARQDILEGQFTNTALSKSPSVNPDSLTNDFENMSIGKKSDNPHIYQESTNSYQKIIQRDNDSMKNKREKQEFVPNKISKSRNSASSESKAARHKPAKPVTEESAVYPPKYKHQHSELISLSESMQLTLEQEKRREELAIERTTLRLLGLTQAAPKMSVYDPPSTDMDYRLADSQDQQGLDSDDDFDEDES